MKQIVEVQATCGDYVDTMVSSDLTYMYVT